jgi:hypothetical protein
MTHRSHTCALLALLASAFTANAQTLPEDIDWKGAPPGFLYFRYEVLPVMRWLCGAPECHGGYAGGRLHLAPPLETGEYSNQAALANYNSAALLVNPGDRLKSLIMLKPLRPDSYEKGVNVVPHAGPKLVTARADPASPERMMYMALLDWVKGRRVANFTPIAFAGRNRTVPLATQVVLDGSLSFDPNPEDMRRLRYQWTIVARPDASQATLKGPNKINATFTADREGTYIVRLTVRDRTRTSEPSYVVITCGGQKQTLDETILQTKTTEQHSLELAAAAIGGNVKKVSDPDSPSKFALNVDPKGKVSGEAAWNFNVARGGKYGVFVLVKDKAGGDEAVRGPMGVVLNGRQMAVLPVPADDERWRMVQFGSTTPLRAAKDDKETPTGPLGGGLAGGIWKKMSGEFEEDGTQKRLLAVGSGLGGRGINIAEIGVDAEGGMIISAMIRPCDTGFKMFNRNGTTTAGSNVMTCNTDGLLSGAVVSGSNLPAGATIASVDSNTQITLTTAATGTGSQAMEFKTPTTRDVRNGYIIFDYKGPGNFKFAGVNINPVQPNQSIFEIDWIGGPRGKSMRQTVQADLEPNKDYTLRLELEEDTATLYFEGHKTVTQKFPAAFTGKMGLASFQSHTEFDNVVMWRNQQLIYTNGFGDEVVLGDESGTGDDPTKRLKRRKMLTFRLAAGKHNLKLNMFPGCPDVEKVVVARLDTLADVPAEQRKLTRAVYIDLLGRGPTEEEMARDSAKPPAELVRELCGRYEFWDWFYEQELFHLDLTDNYRPISEEDPEYHYLGIPAMLNNRKITWVEALRQVLHGVYFHAKNYGDEDYPRGLWFALYGADILDEPIPANKDPILEIARNMYTEGKILEDPNELKDPKAKKKPVAKKVAKEWPLFGKNGKNRADLLDICLAQPRFVETFVRRVYKRYTGMDPTQAEVDTSVKMLQEGWKPRKEGTRANEALPQVVAMWCTGDRYLAKLREYRRKNDAAFIRTLYVDLLNRTPEFHEFWGAYRIIRSLSDNEPLRSIVATMMVDSDESDIPTKAEIVRDEWIKETLMKLYCRAPKGAEVQGLDVILRDAACTTKTLVRALVTHPEYQFY